MQIRFAKAEFDLIRADVMTHLAALPSAIDSFLESHILGSSHYQIMVEGDVAGFASIHSEQLITQFALNNPWKRYGQDIFRLLKKLEQVKTAYVPTCDELYLSHALDEYQQLTKQAYFFTQAEFGMKYQYGVKLVQATLDDFDRIQQHSGDFFANIKEYIAKDRLFLVEREAVLVGFGLIEESQLYRDVASIGMFVIERYRQQGVGTATIQALMAFCEQCGFRPIAGCWYYNHHSKKTLERAGMFTQTRLLRVEY